MSPSEQTANLPQTTRQWILRKKIAPGEDLDTPGLWELVENVPLFVNGASPQGKILIKQQYLSNDPAMRGWMATDDLGTRMYRPTRDVNLPVECGVASEVIASWHPDYAPGDWIMSYVGWTEYAVIDPEDKSLSVLKIPQGVTPEQAHCWGLVGLTAYFGVFYAGLMNDVEEQKKVKVALVNVAAGGVGVLVCQILKHVLGVEKVIATAGSDEKCKFLKDVLKVDVALNYKNEGWKEEFVKETPEGQFVDYFFDMEGGTQLDFCIRRVNDFGIVVACGVMDLIKDEKKTALSAGAYAQVVYHNIRIHGFLLMPYFPKADEAVGKLVQWAQEGKVKPIYTSTETSFEQIPEAFKDAIYGKTTKGIGKTLTKIKWE